MQDHTSGAHVWSPTSGRSHEEYQLHGEPSEGEQSPESRKRLLRRTPGSTQDGRKTAGRPAGWPAGWPASQLAGWLEPWLNSKFDRISLDSWDFMGFLWISVDFIGFQMILMDFKEFWWILIDFNRFQLIFVDFNGL